MGHILSRFNKVRIPHCKINFVIITILFNPIHTSVHLVILQYSLDNDYSLSVDRVVHYSTMPLHMWLLAQGLHTLVV